MLIWLADSVLAEKQKRAEKRLEEIEVSQIADSSKRSLTKIFSGMRMPNVPILFNKHLRFFYLARWIVLWLYIGSIVFFGFLIAQHKNTKIFGKAVIPEKQVSLE
jgi:hypothetical protein